MLKNVLLGAALGLAFPLAQADTAAVRYSNFTATVIDLDATDAYAPDYGGAEALQSGWLSESRTFGNVSAWRFMATLNPTGKVSQAGFNHTGAKGTVSADLVNGVFESKVDVTAPEMHYESNLYPVGAGGWEHGLGIALAPNTGVTVSFDTYASAEFTATCWSGKVCSSVSFSPILILKVRTAPDGGGSFVTDAIDYYDETARASMGPSYSHSERISVTYENTTGDWLYVSPSTDFYFRGQVGAVPEPETWAMMLGGLAAMGAVARRRKASAVRR